jgi:hypothetical protein
MKLRIRSMAAAAFLVGAGATGLAPAYMLAPNDPAYVKECGSCHMAFSAELLPAASWRKVMSRLDSHFGDSASVDAATQSGITEYLVAHSADRATNDESRAIVASIRGEPPMRITEVPYIAELHNAVLDPIWKGEPRPKRLTECGVCHRKAERGDYKSKIFKVTDEEFRGRK